MPAYGVISATVVAPSATDAGALATAFNVLNPSESIRLAAGLPGVEYLIIAWSGEQFSSRGWHALEVPNTVARSSAGVSDGKFELVVNLEINLQKEGFAKRA